MIKIIYTCNMKPQMRKAIPTIIILILAVVLFFARQLKNRTPYRNQGTANTQTTRKASSDVNRDRGFDRRVSYLEYSDHARCRMKCRKITQKEVEEIMKEGKINYRKSELQTTRCPRYA